MSGPSTSKSSKGVYRDTELDDMIRAVHDLPLEEKKVADAYLIALDDLESRQIRIQDWEEQLVREKSDVKEFRERLFQQIRNATGVKKARVTSPWAGDKSGFYVRGATINTVASMQPMPRMIRTSCGGYKSVSSINFPSTPYAFPSALDDVAEKEKMQIAPPHKMQMKKDEKRSGKEFGGRKKW